MKAFFFDRDGTLNIDSGYINNSNNMVLFPSVLKVLQYIKFLGYKIFVISNQSGIGRGFIKPFEYRSVSNKFLSLVGNNIIDDILYCPHSPKDECICRKPKTFFLEIVNEHYDIDFEKSFFVGDKITDIDCGRSLGMRTILIQNNELKNGIHFEGGTNVVIPDKIIGSIKELMDFIKE